jgi:dipeptide/tripeptide permease
MSQSVAPTRSQSPASGSIPGIDHHPRALYVLFATEMWERYGF